MSSLWGTASPEGGGESALTLSLDHVIGALGLYADFAYLLSPLCSYISWIKKTFAVVECFSVFLSLLVIKTCSFERCNENKAKATVVQQLPVVRTAWYQFLVKWLDYNLHCIAEETECRTEQNHGRTASGWGHSWKR